MPILRTLQRSVLCILALAALAACTTRSISDSGYRVDGDYRARTNSNSFYRGEVTAYDVLGIDAEKPISDDDIRKALSAKQPIAARKGSALMLVQSGAAFPDHDMVAALERYYTVAAFSGMPMETRSNPEAAKYAQVFRLAAAKGGYQTIVVYWGVLESATQGAGGKVMSWLPIIGSSIPDQSQQMRIRLMVAVIDVASGQWETFAPEPFFDEALSAERGRAVSDQEQVALLKGKAYRSAAETLVQRYSR